MYRSILPLNIAVKYSNTQQFYCNCLLLINISMGKDMGSILLKVGFFFCHFILSKRCLLTSLNLSFSQVYQYFLISKQKKFLPHAGFEPGSLLNLISAWYPFFHWLASQNMLLASQNMLLPPFLLLVLQCCYWTES